MQAQRIAALPPDGTEFTIEDILLCTMCLATMLLVRDRRIPPDFPSPIDPDSITDGFLQEVVDKLNYILDRFSKKMAPQAQVAAVLERSAYLYERAAVPVKSDQAVEETEDVDVLF